MTLLTVTAVAFGLSVDAFAASLAKGCAVQRGRIFAMAALIAILFGGFQAVMPYVGWQIGEVTYNLIADWDHWVAFGILAAIGSKTIYEGLHPDDEVRADNGKRGLTLVALVITAIATSIDALAAGFGFSMVDQDMWALIILSGVITFLMSWVGVYLGCRISQRFGSRVETVGGLVLIAIGFNILYQHLYA